MGLGGSEDLAFDVSSVTKMLQDERNSPRLPECWYFIYKMRALEQNLQDLFCSGIRWLSSGKEKLEFDLTFGRLPIIFQMPC